MRVEVTEGWIIDSAHCQQWEWWRHSAIMEKNKGERNWRKESKFSLWRDFSGDSWKTLKSKKDQSKEEKKTPPFLKI